MVLVNSNPATIMTDAAMADHVYIEPLTPEVIRRIIEKEKPDSLLSTLGGQTGLTLSMQLAKEGFLQSHGVALLGANLETIDKAEDRQLFKDAMESIGQPVVPSKVVETVEDAMAFAGEIGYPVIVRPAFTLGGTGGGIAATPEELHEIAQGGLRLSPITQVLIEKCISGWKEIEFEVMRDKNGNAITVCSMENLDPVGVHTGDSIVIAPAVTLADKEYQMLRSAALRTRYLRVHRGRLQLPVRPQPRQLPVCGDRGEPPGLPVLGPGLQGHRLSHRPGGRQDCHRLYPDEIPNEVTGKTCACFEPVLDYVVVKFPKWPFDKFVYAKRTLGTQMKATGEVMAIGQTFEEALMKAVRGAEISQNNPRMEALAPLDDKALEEKILACDDQRLFAVYEGLCRGMTVEQIHQLTRIDRWFLEKLQNLRAMEETLSRGPVDEATYRRAKKMGYLDKTIRELSGGEIPFHLPAVYKMVDTCGAEFAAETPYFYAAYDEEDEAAPFIAEKKDGRRPWCWSSAPVPSGSARGSSSTTARSTASGPSRGRAARWSSSTTTRRRSPPTSTPPTACTLSPSPPRMCWTSSGWRSLWGRWWPSAGRPPSS